jgi:DNA polymerase III delta subunit-like protein
MADALRGQDEALALLRAALRSGHVGHAYLFHGPSGVGKTRAALFFARALLCESPLPDGSPDETCESCRMALALRHPDLELRVPLPTFSTEGRTERQAEEARSEARAAILSRYASDLYYLPIFAKPAVHSVEDMARAKQFLSLTARRENGYKVLILKGAEAMTGPAAHAFLKMLEEPHPRRVLILGARQARSLLPTVQSRCLHVRFRPLPAGMIAEVLEARGIPKPVARLAGATSDGSLGKALQHFETPVDAVTGKAVTDPAELSKLRATALDLFVTPHEPGVLGPLRKGRIERDRPRFLAALALALHYYRDLLRYRVLGETAPLGNEDLRARIAADARALTVESVTRRVRLLEEIAESVQSNVTIPYAVASFQHRMAEARP